jgi:hypothetical protein
MLQEDVLIHLVIVTRLPRHSCVLSGGDHTTWSAANYHQLFPCMVTQTAASKESSNNSPGKSSCHHAGLSSQSRRSCPYLWNPTFQRGFSLSLGPFERIYKRPPLVFAGVFWMCPHRHASSGTHHFIYVTFCNPTAMLFLLITLSIKTPTIWK